MRLLKRWQAETVIRYDGTRAYCIKGNLSPSVLRDVDDIFERSCPAGAEIWISTKPRLTFSPEIPKSVHQAFRNTVLGVY